MEPILDCICCRKKHIFRNVEQIVLTTESRKDRFFSFVCKSCLEKKKDGDVLVVIEPYGKLILLRDFGLTAKSLKNMMSNHILMDYHYKLFQNWRK